MRYKNRPFSKILRALEFDGSARFNGATLADMSYMDGDFGLDDEKIIY